MIFRTDRIRQPLERFISKHGTLFARFPNQDSGCMGYGLDTPSGRFFVKHATTPRAHASLRRARRLHRLFSHPAVPPLQHHIQTPTGLALFYTWVEGDCLYEPAEQRALPHSALSRFRNLPIERRLAVLDTLIDIHVELEDFDYVAVDFYDGCVIYNFDTHQVFLVDLDEYQRGGFALLADRLPGSTRFMAPEDWQYGAWIGPPHTVYSLGRAGLVLCGDGTLQGFDGPPSLRNILEQATQPQPEARFEDAYAMWKAWMGERDVRLAA